MNKNSVNDTTKKSHFIMIPIEDPYFIEAYNLLVNNINSFKMQNISPHLFQKDGKLHFTVCTLNIGEDLNIIEKYTNVLAECNQELKKITNGGVKFNFGGFSTLGEGQNTRIVYVKMKEDDEYTKILDVINFIISLLVSKKLISEEELKQNFITFDSSTKRYSITIHLTILNILFLNKILRKEKSKPLKSFNTNQLMKTLENETLPSANITLFNFCRMREDKKTEKYEVIKSYNF